MYRIPKDFDISQAIGQYTTQIRVGEFDIQFTVGEVNFSIESLITLTQNGNVIGQWFPGAWPDLAFGKVLNVDLVRYEVPNDRVLILYFQNGIEMHLQDNSDKYESMHIHHWII